MTVHPPKPWPRADKKGEKYRSCWMCDGSVYNQVEIRFDSGSVEPTEDETLTGATSGDTGVVESIQLESGTWAGGDAAGTVWLSAPTGHSDIMTDGGTGEWGEDDENVNGSVGGNNMLTLNGHGNQKRYGVLYPQGDMIEASDGHWYCRAHWAMRFVPDARAEYPIDVDDRGE